MGFVTYNIGYLEYSATNRTLVRSLCPTVFTVQRPRQTRPKEEGGQPGNLRCADTLGYQHHLVYSRYRPAFVRRTASWTGGPGCSTCVRNDDIPVPGIDTPGHSSRASQKAAPLTHRSQSSTEMHAAGNRAWLAVTTDASSHILLSLLHFCAFGRPWAFICTTLLWGS